MNTESFLPWHSERLPRCPSRGLSNLETCRWRNYQGDAAGCAYERCPWHLPLDSGTRS